MAKISVIIPVYNVEKYIGQCLESVVGQSLPEIEIICVDDKCTDNSMETVRKFARKDKRIKILTHSKNKGLSAARNTGLKESSAPYVMFLDSDDWYDADMCAKMLNAMESSKADIAVCGIKVVYEACEEYKESDDRYYRINFSGKQEVSDEILLNTAVSACNKIYRKDFLDKFDISFPDGLKYEDVYFYNVYMCHARSIFFLDEKLFIRRRRDGSIMSMTFERKDSSSVDQLTIALRFFDYLQKHNLYERKKDYFLNLFVRCLNFSFKYASSEKDKKKICKTVLKFMQKKHFDENFKSCVKKRFPQIEEESRRTFLFCGNQNEKYCCFGVPVFEVRRKGGKNKYYLFGIKIYKN